MPMTDTQMDIVSDAISEADPHQLSSVLADAIERLGEHGRPGAEALLERLQARRLDNPDGFQIEEGLAQISGVEGVLDGRLESL